MNRFAIGAGSVVIFFVGFGVGKLGQEESDRNGSSTPTASSRTNSKADSLSVPNAQLDGFHSEIINRYTNQALPFKSRSAEVLAIPEGGKRYRALAALLEELDSGKALELIEAIQENDLRGVDGGREWEMLFERWGQVQPAEAAEFLTTAELSDWHVHAKDGALAHLMKGWGQSSPEAALSFIDSHEDLKPSLAAKVFAGWAAKDPQAAASAILADPDRYGDHLEIVSQEMCRAGGADAFLEWREMTLPQLADNSKLRRQLDILAVKRMRFAPREKLAAWAAEQSRDHPVSGFQAATFAYNESRYWFPQSTMTFIDQLVGAKASESVLSYCIQRETGDDPGRVGEWLNGQPLSPELDPVRKSYALSLAQTDQQAAMEWAETLQNLEEKARVVAEIQARANPVR